MKSALRTVTQVLITAVLGFAVFAGGLVAGQYYNLPSIPLQALGLPGNFPGVNTSTSSREAMFAPFWEAWDLVHREYVEQPVDDTALMRGAIRGMLAALGDEHSQYLAPDQASVIGSSTSGELEGIGAYVEAAEAGGLIIVSPFSGSPAEAVGLRAGDRVVQVDGVDVVKLDKFKIITLVRGPAGSTVRLTVVRTGVAEPLEFTVTRAKINVPSVESKMLDGQIAYVKINNFGARTTSELTQALEEMLNSQPAGLILDLRANPGGLRDTAIEVASQFLPRGSVVMREQYSDGHEVTYKARGGGLATELPLVVLINKESASASEIVSGAVQDHQRGRLVGETSYGKGSVQNWHTLANEQGLVTVTVARWLTPDGRWINGQGIAPDVVIGLSLDDHTAGRDPQLDEAIRQFQVPAAAPG